MKKMKTLSLIIISLIFAAIPYTSDEAESEEVAYTNTQFEKVKLISRGKLINVIDYLEPHKYTVFMFSADWCAPCGPLKEKLSELANKVDTMALRELDIINLENPLVKYYNLPAIPYFLIYGPDGKFVERGPMISKKVLKAIASRNN